MLFKLSYWSTQWFSASTWSSPSTILVDGWSTVRPELAMVLVSGFGEQGEVMGTRFFVMRHKFLLCTHFFVMCHRNIVMRWRITKKQAHYKKLVGALWKNGHITKKRVPVTSACSPKPETRTIANPGHVHGDCYVIIIPIYIEPQPISTSVILCYIMITADCGSTSMIVYYRSGFSQTHKIGKIAIIANFVFPYICSFHHCLHHMMLINMKLEVGDCKKITLQGC